MDTGEEQVKRTRENEHRSRSRRRGLLIGGAIALVLALLTAGTIALVLIVSPDETARDARPSSVAYQERYVSGEGPDKIVVLPIHGQLEVAGAATGLRADLSTPEGMRNALQQAAEDESVAAVILEINSPGGEVTASDRMHQLISDFRQTAQKPVVVSMGPTAASGAYYISTPADNIVANRTTLTGSLGVLLQVPDVSEAADNLGVRMETIKGGELKDMLSPFKGLSPEEREILQSIADESYDRFVEVVVEGRGLPEERVRELADGRVYSGEQALELGLVDEIGTLDTAVELSRELAGVEEATVVSYERTASLGELFRLRFAPDKPEALQIMEAAGIELEPKLQYLYQPGL